MSVLIPLDLNLIPSYDEMAYYIIQALINLNDSGSNQEIYENIEENLLRNQFWMALTLLHFQCRFPLKLPVQKTGSTSNGWT